MWCKIIKLLKYYNYQLTKCCSEEILEGFKVSSWFLKGTQLMHMRIRYHFLPDLRVTRHGRETEREKRIRNT